MKISRKLIERFELKTFNFFLPKHDRFWSSHAVSNQLQVHGKLSNNLSYLETFSCLDLKRNKTRLLFVFAQLFFFFSFLWNLLFVGTFTISLLIIRAPRQVNQNQWTKDGFKHLILEKVCSLVTEEGSSVKYEQFQDYWTNKHRWH